MSKIKTAYRWEANWKITLLFVLLLPLLLKLGFWQLSRVEEKRALAQQLVERQAMPPLSMRGLQELMASDKTGLVQRRIQLFGRYEPEQVYLLDNQIFNGAVGYQVLQVFEVEWPANVEYTTSAGQKVLINRGWIPGYADRRLPEVSVPQGTASLIASVYIPSSESVVLVEDVWSASWPKVIQATDMDKIRAQAGEALFPYELRLEPGEWSALTIAWPEINTGPKKHLGYAVQWFAMAVALVIAWLFTCLHKQIPVSEPEEIH